jgi:hypothetical protein
VATFEILFGKEQHPHVKYFVFFCNLVNILHAGPTAAATKIKIQIWGFLQVGKLLSLTALDKLLKCFPVSAFLSGKWERCKGGLYGNEEYDICGAENSPRIPIQTRGEFGISKLAPSLYNAICDFVCCDEAFACPAARIHGKMPLSLHSLILHQIGGMNHFHLNQTLKMDEWIYSRHRVLKGTKPCISSSHRLPNTARGGNHVLKLGPDRP